LKSFKAILQGFFQFWNVNVPRPFAWPFHERFWPFYEQKSSETVRKVYLENSTLYISKYFFSIFFHFKVISKVVAFSINKHYIFGIWGDFSEGSSNQERVLMPVSVEGGKVYDPVYFAYLTISKMIQDHKPEKVHFMWYFLLLFGPVYKFNE